MESLMIILDNSEWNRNSDYFPSRFDAQKDAALLMFDSRLRSNIENCVGLLMMAGSNPKLLITPTSERPKFETTLFGAEAKVTGQPNCLSAIQIAQLALKHRSNKGHSQRIMLFVGSPLNAYCTQPELTALGKKLKKNGIAVDVVLFGEIDSSRPLLSAFIEAVNSNDNSHLLTVEASRGIRDALSSSDILRSGAASMDIDAGIDAEVDPELAEAIRLSLEEQARHAQPQETVQSAPLQPSDAPMMQSDDHNERGGAEEEDEELRQAIAMSLEQNPNSTFPGAERTEHDSKTSNEEKK